jgi:hypothetical protein
VFIDHVSSQANGGARQPTPRGVAAEGVAMVSQ